jgi:KDO2-lipid IV(A) lauroyltransferase
VSFDGAVLPRLRDTFRTNSAFWRKALHAGVHFGPDPWVRYSPAVFGLAFCAALSGPRESVRRILRKVHGPRPAHEELRDVAEVFTNFASSMSEAMLVGAARGYVPTSRPLGDWHFLSSYARGRGVIIAAAQTAGWDIGGAMLSNVQAKDVLVVMEPEADDAARELHDRYRHGAGVKVVHVGRDPLASLALLRHLRSQGGIVALKFDRVHPGMRRRQVRFLGDRWQVPEGPLSLAAMTGAPIVPVFTRRLGFLEYELINHPPIYLPRRPDQEALDAAAQTLADALESFVRKYPTHWFRFRDE